MSFRPVLSSIVARLRRSQTFVVAGRDKRFSSVGAKQYDKHRVALKGIVALLRSSEIVRVGSTNISLLAELTSDGASVSLSQELFPAHGVSRQVRGFVF